MGNQSVLSRWHEWAVNAFFSNRETAFQDYVRSIVRNDTARPYEGNLYSFSVVQIFTALSDLVHFWQELQWPGTI